MNKNTTSYPNSLVIILTFLILMGTSIMDFNATCFAQSPWTKIADMPTGRWELSTCVVDGKIYAIGGAGPVWQPLGTVEVYDPATDTWTTKSPRLTAGQGLSISVVDGKIYAIGGAAGSSSSYSSLETFSTVEEYDPMTDTWTSKSPMPKSRGFHSANVVDGKIYIIGGSHDSGPDRNHVRTVEEYDPATDTWTQMGDMPRGMGAGFSSVFDGKIYAFGGYGGARRVDEYDPATDTWTSKSDMPTGRNAFTTSTLDSKIYVIGGYVVPTLPGYPGLITVDIYDPATDTWDKATDMPTGRFGPRSSVVDGKIYVIGGMVKWITTASRIIEEYDPSKDLTGVERIDSKLPKQFDLNQNYPNPFNPSTKISYSIPNSGFVILKVYDMLGREVETLVNKFQNAKTYSVNFDAGKLASGIYFYKLQTDGGYSEMRKMSLAK
jgi:N-acetylneuraminic acid mutarotase